MNILNQYSRCPLRERRTPGPTAALAQRCAQAIAFALLVACGSALADEADISVESDDGFQNQALLPGIGGGHYRHAVTLWWVIFNNPNACLAAPLAQEKCGAVDLFGQAYLDSIAAGNPDPSLIDVNTAAGVGVLYATGGVTERRNARVRLAASIYASPFAHLDLSGPQSVDPLLTNVGFINRNSEVHLVVRDHGRVVRGAIVTQITNFLEPYCSDPLLGWQGGDNRCEDIQAAVYATDEQGKDAVYRLSDGQMLSYASAYLFRQGDVMQAVVDTRIPDRRYDVIIQE